MRRGADIFTALVLIVGAGLLTWGGYEVWSESLDRMVRTRAMSGLFAFAQLLWIAAGGLLALALELGQHRTTSSTVMSLVIAGIFPVAVLLVFWLWGAGVTLPGWLFPWGISNGPQSAAGVSAGLLLITAALRARRSS